jgi:putative redox protein
VGTAEVTLAGRTFTITRQFLDDLGAQNFLDDLAEMRKALLVCHAPQDEYVGIENPSAILPPPGIPRASSHLTRRIIYCASRQMASTSRK